MKLRAGSLCLVLLALSAAACGTTSSSSSSAGSSSSAASHVASTSARAVPAGAIRLMVIAAVATPIQNYPAAPAGAEAAADAINKSGGIKGHKVVIDVCNTQSNANDAVACARKAASNGDVAVVGHIEAQTSLTMPVLQQEQIPDIGNYSTGNAIDWTSPIAFPISGGSPSIFMALPSAMKKLGKGKLAILYLGVPAGANQAKLIDNAAKAAHISVVASIAVPATATDFDPYVFQLRDHGADSAILVTSVGVSEGLMRSAASLGLHVLFSHTTSTIGEAEAAQIGAPASGMLLGAAYPSYRDTQYPGVRTWIAQMKAAGDGGVSLLKPEGLNAWLGVYGFADIAKSTSGTLTHLSVLAALKKQKAPINLFGLAKWAPGAPGPLPQFPRWNRDLQVFFSTVRSGNIVAWGGALPPTSVLQQLRP